MHSERFHYSDVFFVTRLCKHYSQELYDILKILRRGNIFKYPDRLDRKVSAKSRNLKINNLNCFDLNAEFYRIEYCINNNCQQQFDRLNGK